MDRQRWPKVKELFQAALARPPEDRAAFIAEMGNGDEELSRETKRLLDAHEKMDAFIERPAFEVAPELLVADPPSGFIDQTIAHYQVESLLGVGGMGEVYLAQDERLHRKVALKFLPPRFTKDPILNQRFRQEAQTVSALNHPNIVTIHEIGEVDGIQFMATEFVDGKTLRQRMDEAPVPLPEALEIAIQIASALSAAHGAGVVHRDIKPENIMLRADGYVKVLDFGIAKLTESQQSKSPAGATPGLAHTQEGTTVGTPFYMSPEQARNEKLDARTDLWSVGVILFEMVAGERPFSGATSADVIARVLQNDPPPLDRSAPGQLRRIIARALAKDKEKRYQSANDLRRDLQKVRDKSGSFIRHGWRSAALAALVVATGSSALWFWNRAPTPSSADKQSIAVLPFQNLSHEPDHSYLPEAMQGEILACLTKIGDLKVISRSSTQRYQSAPDNLREIGQQLGVANILEGSVQRMANDVRINVQLINAATGEHVWAHTYERTIENLFTVEREVAQTVADSLKINLRPAQRAKVETPPTKNAEAYDLFLRGVYELDRAWIEEASSSGTATKAADYFRQAIAIDPEFS
ncbi:MAG TPA: serine/threonine-protein kinase, partial [Chthoniobacterales bacterium]